MAAIRVAVVGAGRIAARHLEVLKALPDVAVAGFFSRTRARAEALARQHGAGIVAQDLEALVREARPDALLILVSAASIYPVALAALEFGLPVFLEKPAGLTPEQTGELAVRARAKGIPTMVGYNRRYYSVFHRGIERLAGYGCLLGIAIEGHERIGRVRATGAHPEEVLRAWLFANATHTIDLLRLFGGEVREVRGFAYRRQEPLVDGIAAALEFENGALGQYGAHWLSPSGWRVALYGEGISVEFAPLEHGRWIDDNGGSGTLVPSAQDERFKPGLFGQMQAFCALARGGVLTWPALDLAGAHSTMRLAEALAKGAKALPSS